MNPKTTWFWTVLAVALFAFIFFFEQHIHQPPQGPPEVLPGLRPSSVTRIRILPIGQLEISVERTNGGWQLTTPVVYPAQNSRIDALLSALERLRPETYFTPQELKNMRQADVQFGFQPPQKSLTLEQGDEQTLIHIGSRTAPGDQVFVQVVGVGEVYVVDADLLKWIPEKPDDWRDPRLVDLNRVKFDHLLVTNAAAGKTFELQRNPTNRLWRMILPGWEPRADSDKVEEALQRLENLRAEQFVSDDPKADLDSYGLQTPALSLALADGTNTQVLLEFGKSPTNSPGEIYARRADQSCVLAVSKEMLGPWNSSYDVFRDRHLVTLTVPLDEIEVTARDHFILRQDTNGDWNVVPQGFPADSALVRQLIDRLGALRVADFPKDVLTAQDLPEKGLATPAMQFILRAATTNAAGVSNRVVAQLDFGTNQDDKIFARRADESTLYTVMRSDLATLPTASWQMRDRRVWNFNENDVARLVIHQEGKIREIDRRGTNSWSLAAGSSGDINDLALDEVTHQLGELEAANWVARGDVNREAFGLAPTRYQLSVELKNGRLLTVEFGGTAPSGFPYASTVLDNQPWIFEFPWPLYQYVKSYLTIPAYIH